MFGSFGGVEVLIIIGVFFLLFGAKRLPELANALGKSKGEFQRGLNEATSTKLAETVADVVGFKGEIVWDTSKPNGTPRKVLNIEKIKTLGWKPKISLREGIQSTYEWFKDFEVKK